MLAREVRELGVTRRFLRILYGKDAAAGAARCSLKPSGNRDNDHGSWGKKWPAWKMVMSIA